MGVDLDGCINPETGEVTPAARALVDELDSYTEISPSGRGLHIFVEATLPPGRRVAHDLGIEMYGQGRFFTITGRRLNDTPAIIADRNEVLRALHTRLFGIVTPKETITTAPPVPTNLDDRAVIDKASGAVNGMQFYALWRGDTSRYMHDDNDGHSEGDLALCNALAFWTGDKHRVDSLFRQSGLMRDKWDVKHYSGGATYGEATIDKAFAGRTEFYQPHRTPMTAMPLLPSPTPIPPPQVAAPEPTPLRYQFMSDIDVQSLPPLTWVVDKLLPDGCLTTIYGEPWTGKSFVALDIGCHVAEEIAWNGRKVKGGPVVYIAAEGMRGMQLRIKAWKIARHIPLDYSIPIHFLGVPVPILDSTAIGQLLLSIRALPVKPRLIIFDTLGRSFVGGEENSNDDMNMACNAAKVLQEETNANVIFVHHKGKNSPSMRGGSALLGGVDTAIEVTKDETSPLVTLTCKKQKDGAEPFATISMRLKPVMIDEANELSSCALVSVDASARLDELTGTPRTAFMAIAGEFDHMRGATSKEWQQAASMAYSTFQDARAHLVIHDYVANPEQGKGTYYKLTKKGIDWFGLVRRTNAVPYADD